MTAAAAMPKPEAVDSVATHERLVAALRDRLAAGGIAVRLVETHISSVLVTEDRAYKIKKPVALPFLDFSTLAARKHFCEEELKLNRRVAPQLYLAVVPVTGSVEAPTLHGAGPILDYAVMMRAFAADALASEAIARGAFSRTHTDALAITVARAHACAPRADRESCYGTPAEALAAALANCAEILSVPDAALAREDIEAIATWTRGEHTRIAALLEHRHDTGRVRELHGDLHLGNVALIDGDPTLFDGIEFDPRLRWIDVMSDIAFLVMDFHDRGRPDLGHRLLNVYLEQTGDYPGLLVLRFYLVYRAMVRAKVAALRAHQLHAGAAYGTAVREAADYLALAQRFTRGGRAALVVMHGFAGSGKSTAAESLLELTGAVRVRTDVERKRLRGLAPAAASDSALGGGLYTDDATERTYRAALDHAGTILDAGALAIVDGTFLRRWQRDIAREVAAAHGVPIAFLDVKASMPSLRQRIVARRIGPRDASEATLEVLERQIATAEPFGPDELRDVLAYDSETSDPDAPEVWREVLDRLGVRPLQGIDATVAADALAGRIAFLSQPANYSDPTTAVAVIETHWSWVFLTDRFAYKLKKPVRTGFADLTQLEGRRRNAEAEVRLNRRLAPDVYLGVEPLYERAEGGFAFGAGTVVVDWLVRTRRLPASGMLDAVVRSGRLTSQQVRAVVERLCALYAAEPAVAISPERYLARFRKAVADDGRELLRPTFALPPERVAAVRAMQERALLRVAPMLAERAAAGKIREGHGDLRPEHVFVDGEPVIIDCLEFASELRLLDPADEIAFLALGCERLGFPAAGSAFRAAYRFTARDPVPEPVMEWYAGFRAVTRARLAALHLAERPPRPGSWTAQALDYLDLATRHLERCG